MKLSARNTIKGTVASVEKGAVNATVRIDVGGGTIITSVITNDAVEELALTEGKTAYAVIKASHVMVAAED
ncbi:molybdenum-pterin-binding protein [Meridianimarinicoccus roseus]|uniref:Molybdenum-pterin-binding protein n=1 Tax=Meridianimarinicoccus roseus TaxID=2072018 RepID=A0A2V2L6R2_9RHOB|nr:TOBE domain-containing protein [Meridianimarinicoccus roseus]PWR01118.1 molybdenum-pterin-binding protein [Meridianimarinicoccus roseus]